MWQSCTVAFLDEVRVKGLVREMMSSAKELKCIKKLLMHMHEDFEWAVPRVLFWCVQQYAYVCMYVCMYVYIYICI